MGRFTGHLSNADPERLERVLDAKARLIGVDKAALDAQVAEHNARKATELRAARDFTGSALQADRAACELQRQADALQRSWNRKVQEFRATAQGKHGTREFDLNRADGLRLDAPARVGDDDARCGPASLQRFEGEDLTAGDRLVTQQAQCREWWAQQLAARSAAEQGRQAHEQELASGVRAQDELQRTVLRAEDAARRRVAADTLSANKQLAEARATAAAAAQQLDARDQLAELQATLSDPWLAEHPSLAASAVAHRVRKDHFKGLRPSQLTSIRDEQAAQVEAHHATTQRAKQESAEFEQQQQCISSQLAAEAERGQALRRAKAQEVARALRAQMDDKKARTAALDSVYAGQIKPAYFDQWGSSHR